VLPPRGQSFDGSAREQDRYFHGGYGGRQGPEWWFNKGPQDDRYGRTIPAVGSDVSLATRLLDLQVDDVHHHEHAGALEPFGCTLDRSRKEIADEHGQVVRQFLKE
jgi:hypothetical protein